MKKLYVQNLVLIITERCNFSCEHCMHGSSINKDIDDSTIERLFSQISGIDNLAISGGEPFMVAGKIQKLFNTIKKNNIKINQYGLATNGTLYNDEIEKIFDDFEEYVNEAAPTNTRRFNENKHGYIDLSKDMYHTFELEKFRNNDCYQIYLNNQKALIKSKYFLSIKYLENGLINIGRATDLDTVKHDPKKIKLYHYSKKDTIFVGPIVMISSKGNIVDYDSTYSDMEKYSYGNVLEKPLEEIILSSGDKCKTLRKFYHKSDMELHEYKKIDF